MGGLYHDYRWAAWSRTTCVSD